MKHLFFFAGLSLSRQLKCFEVVRLPTDRLSSWAGMDFEYVETRKRTDRGLHEEIFSAEQACHLYFITDTDQKIEMVIEFNNADWDIVSQWDNYNFLEVVDNWEIEGHPLPDNMNYKNLPNQSLSPGKGIHQYWSKLINLVGSRRR